MRKTSTAYASKDTKFQVRLLNANIFMDELLKIFDGDLYHHVIIDEDVYFGDDEC